MTDLEIEQRAIKNYIDNYEVYVDGGYVPNPIEMFIIEDALYGWIHDRDKLMQEAREELKNNDN